MEEKIRAMQEILEKHYDVLKELPKPERYQVGGTYYGSTELLTSVGNHLELVENCSHTSYGYGCNTNYKDACILRIGGAYKYSTKEIREALMAVLSGQYDMETKIGIINDHGTNYSVIGFGFLYC